MNVVQQQNAAAMRVEPPHRLAHDVFLGGPLVLLIGKDIRAPRYQRLGRKEGFYRFGAAEAGDAEERRHAAWIAERRVDRRDTAVNFLLDLLRGQALEGERVILTVGADGVAGVVDAAHQLGVSTRHLADKKIGRLDALRGQCVEDNAGIGRNRTIVEGDDDLVILERQRARILDAAKTGKFAGCYRQHAAGAQRVGITRTLFGPYSGRRCKIAKRDAAESERKTAHEVPRSPRAFCFWKSPNSAANGRYESLH